MQTRRRPTYGTSRPLQPKDLVYEPDGGNHVGENSSAHGWTLLVSAIGTLNLDGTRNSIQVAAIASLPLGFCNNTGVTP